MERAMQWRSFAALSAALAVPAVACSSTPNDAAKDAGSLDASIALSDGTSPAPSDAGRDTPSIPEAGARDATTGDASPFDAAGSDAIATDAPVPDASPPPSCPGDGGQPGVWCDRSIAAGVLWRSRAYTSLYCGPQRVSVVDVDLAQPGISLKPVQQQGSTYETVTAMGARTAAVAGINGGFFCNGSDDICTLKTAQPTCDVSLCNGADPPASGPCAEPSALSLLQIDGVSVSTNCRASRATFGVDAAGRHAAIAEVAPGAPWPQEASAIGAGPLLVAPPDGGGAGVVDVAAESFHWPCSEHARSAVAIDDRGHVLLVAFDGGHGATGVTLPQLADFLVSELHAVQAMNLDGGGSTTLYVRGTGVANVPSGDNGSGPVERPVFDGLYVLGP
jgi:hypothetical protein